MNESSSISRAGPINFVPQANTLCPRPKALMYSTLEGVLVIGVIKLVFMKRRTRED